MTEQTTTSSVLGNIENFAETLLAAVVTGSTTTNQTGQELVISVGGHLANQPEGPAVFTVPLYTEIELGIAKGLIAMLDRMDSKPNDGEVELEGVLKTPKISLLFIKVTLKADVELTAEIREVA